MSNTSDYKLLICKEMLQWTFCRVWPPYLQSCPAVPCHYNELFSEPTEILLRCVRNKSHHLWTNLSHSDCLSYQRTHKSCPNLTRVKQSRQMIQRNIALPDLSCWNIFKQHCLCMAFVPAWSIRRNAGLGERKSWSWHDWTTEPTMVVKICAFSSLKLTPAMEATSLMSSSSLEGTKMKKSLRRSYKFALW